MSIIFYFWRSMVHSLSIKWNKKNPDIKSLLCLSAMNNKAETSINRCDAKASTWVRIGPCLRREGTLAAGWASAPPSAPAPSPPAPARAPSPSWGTKGQRLKVNGLLNWGGWRACVISMICFMVAIIPRLERGERKKKIMAKWDNREKVDWGETKANSERNEITGREKKGKQETRKILHVKKGNNKQQRYNRKLDTNRNAERQTQMHIEMR